MRLTGVQQDCLEARGVCSRCLHGGLMESGPCRVRESHGVAQKLGLQALKPSSDPEPDDLDDVVYRPTMPAIPCRYRGSACEGWFTPGSAVAKFCPTCRREAYERERDVICVRCGITYFGRKKPRMCPDCARS